MVKRMVVVLAVVLVTGTAFAETPVYLYGEVAPP